LALPAAERDLKHYAFTFDLLCRVKGHPSVWNHGAARRRRGASRRPASGIRPSDAGQSRVEPASGPGGSSGRDRTTHTRIRLAGPLMAK
jgi:hypothetical protein